MDEIKIGSQIWMSRNLNVEKFLNGELIREVKTNEDWFKARQQKQPAWCYYKNDKAFGDRFGKLYNWYAVNDPRGLAPKGWHIPSIIEWEALINTLGKNTAGIKIKTDNTNRSRYGHLGNNESVFSALLSGGRDEDDDFGRIDVDAYWWSSEKNTDYSATFFWTTESSTEIYNNSYDIGMGLSVRCIKD